MSEIPSPTEPSAALESLKKVTHEIEQGAARLGWDRPATLYALVLTGELLESADLPADIDAQIRAGWSGEAEHLSAILQDSPGEEEIEEILPRLAWPESVAGAAVSVERIIVPPAVEDAAPEDPEEALEFISSHPTRTDVRLTVGVLRSGESWCAIRTRTFDDDSRVGTGENLVPSLVEGLLAGFAPDVAGQDS